MSKFWIAKQYEALLFHINYLLFETGRFKRRWKQSTGKVIKPQETFLTKMTGVLVAHIIWGITCETWYLSDYENLNRQQLELSCGGTFLGIFDVKELYK